MTLLDAPLRLVLAVVPKERLRRWLRQSAKLVLLCHLYAILRRRAQMCGLHNSIGTAVAYGGQLLKWLPVSLQTLLQLNKTATAATATAATAAAAAAARLSCDDRPTSPCAAPWTPSQFGSPWPRPSTN